MKIGTSPNPQPLADVSVRSARTPSSATPTLARGGSDGEQVAVSAAGAQLGLGQGDFDAAKVDAIRQAIREGRFAVNPEAIADRLIADAAALLRPRGAA